MQADFQKKWKIFPRTFAFFSAGAYNLINRRGFPLRYKKARPVNGTISAKDKTLNAEFRGIEGKMKFSIRKGGSSWGAVQKSLFTQLRP
jgi:hypothetical protein